MSALEACLDWVKHHQHPVIGDPLRGSGTDAYVASLALEWQPRSVEGLGLSLIVDNLTNSNFQEFPGTPAVLRQASFKLRYGW